MEAKTAEHKAFKQRQEEVCFLIFGHIGYMEQQKKDWFACVLVVLALFFSL